MSDVKNEIVVLGVLFAEENKQLTSMILRLAEEANIDADVKQDADILEFIKHKVVLAPGVIINGHLKSVGRLPTEDEIKNWLEELS